jgi:AbrB family looped-hinge helix DNA binding protein
MTTVTVSVRGQLVIPVELRKRYHIKPGDKVMWIDTGKALLLVPLVDNPIHRSRGILSGAGLTQALIRGRKQDKKREEAKAERWRH